MYSVGLEWWDDDAETVVVGDGDACSMEDDDAVDVLLSCWDEDDESLVSNGSKQKMNSSNIVIGLFCVD